MDENGGVGKLLVEPPEKKSKGRKRCLDKAKDEQADALERIDDLPIVHCINCDRQVCKRNHGGTVYAAQQWPDPAEMEYMVSWCCGNEGRCAVDASEQLCLFDKAGLLPDNYIHGQSSEQIDNNYLRKQCYRAFQQEFMSDHMKAMKKTPDLIKWYYPYVYTNMFNYYILRLQV